MTGLAEPQMLHQRLVLAEQVGARFPQRGLRRHAFPSPHRQAFQALRRACAQQPIRSMPLRLAAYAWPRSSLRYFGRTISRFTGFGMTSSTEGAFLTDLLIRLTQSWPRGKRLSFTRRLSRSRLNLKAVGCRCVVPAADVWVEDKKLPVDAPSQNEIGAERNAACGASETDGPSGGDAGEAPHTGGGFCQRARRRNRRADPGGGEGRAGSARQRAWLVTSRRLQPTATWPM